MDKETQAREHVRDLKVLYTHLLIYGAVIVACLVIWAMTGGGYFWPVWVFFALGGSAAVQAVRLGRMTVLHQFFPFLSQEWEEQQVKKLMGTVDKVSEKAQPESSKEK